MVNGCNVSGKNGAEELYLPTNIFIDAWVAPLRIVFSR
jgi:hypothetical protein